MDKDDNYHVNLTLLDLIKLSREDIAKLNRGEFPLTGDASPATLAQVRIYPPAAAQAILGPLALSTGTVRPCFDESNLRT